MRTRKIAAAAHLMALLVLAAVALLVVAGRFAPSLEDMAIAIVMLVYLASWAALVLSLTAWPSLRIAWSEGPRIALGVSASIVLTYVGMVSWTLLAILQSTDL